mmetsp:Transcript_13180/g.38817  ORF Transcript_13180/g.38817 Transcript_13180/m.38817 type:complete len:86 (+) Transcript_13180:538-795(+)
MRKMRCVLRKKRARGWEKARIRRETSREREATTGRQGGRRLIPANGNETAGLRCESARTERDFSRARATERGRRRKEETENEHGE